MRDWLREKIITTLGGFPNAGAALSSVGPRGIVPLIEGLMGKVEHLEDKHRILTKAVKRHFNTVGAEDILKEIAGGEWLVNGKPIPDGKKKLLQAEAISFMATELWKVLQLDLAYQANKKMFVDSKSEVDLIAGKLWVYTIAAIRTRLTSLSKGKGTFNTK